MNADRTRVHSPIVSGPREARIPYSIERHRSRDAVVDVVVIPLRGRYGECDKRGGRPFSQEFALGYLWTGLRPYAL